MAKPEKKKEPIADGETLKRNETPHFFAKQLPGEDALTHATAEKLFELAEEIYAARPWKRMGDTDLVVVKEPGSRQMCYCCVMGELGQVYAVHVYRGPESYRLFKRIASDATIGIGDFYGSQNSVSLQFLPSSELTAADKELARAFGHPLLKGLAAPQFRAIRPGYYPWYVTESEAKVLALCIDSVLAFCEELERTPGKQYWAHEDVYPEVVWRKRSYFTVDRALAQVEPAPPPEPVTLDEERLTKLQKRDYLMHGTLEVDHFYTGLPIGKKQERKGCLRAVMAIDAETPFLYAAEVVGPSESAGQFLTRIMMKTIETAKFIPAEIRVRDENARLLLSPLAARLGFAVNVKESLPVLEIAKQDLLKTMGDPGYFQG